MRIISPHRMLALGSAWYVVLFGMLLTLDSHHWSLWLLALIWALYRSIHWLAFHYTFALARAHKQSTRQIATINALAISATTVAPAIGGVLATYLGVNYIYSIGIVLVLIGLTPMLSGSEGPRKVRLQFSILDIIKMRRDVLANMCNGMIVTAEQSIWPIFVFLIVSSYAGVGLLSSVIGVASVVLTLYVGRHQKLNDRYFMRRGLATYGLASLGRTVAHNSTQVFGLNMFAGIGRSLYLTPFLDRYYTNSDDRQRLGYINTMEAAFSLGALIFLLLLLLISLLVSAKIVLAIGLGIVAFAVIGVRLIR